MHISYSPIAGPRDIGPEDFRVDRMAARLLSALVIPGRTSVENLLIAAPVSGALDMRDRLEKHAIERGHDVLYAHLDEEGGLLIDAGIATHWMMLWHPHCRTFLGNDGEIWFVSSAGIGPSFRMEDGRLDCWMEPPYADEDELRAGLAHAALIAAKLRAEG